MVWSSGMTANLCWVVAMVERMNKALVSSHNFLNLILIPHSTPTPNLMGK